MKYETDKEKNMDTVVKGQGAIEVSNLNVTFEGRRPICAVQNLSFKVSPQEFLCILGTTGCGKSTILNVIAGFIKPTLGKVFLDGEIIEETSPQRGMIFQRFALFPWKTVSGNVEFGLKMKGLDKEKRRTLAGHYIKIVGLGGFEESYPRELSGGMEQRVGIARVLANDPLVMLMDEPFGSLDAQTRLMMQELLLKIWEEAHKTVIFVTHDIDEAILLADRLLILTARPGSVKREIQVTLPRPRTYNILLSPDFIKIKEEVMELIREETIKALNLKIVP